ncbi:hypothetical protein KCP75_11750 [Salmonella enterica subsp. enterica]|nr:hypothetical protein KCP75_11750 [Salmonella enterica subsp. enterica]
MANSATGLDFTLNISPALTVDAATIFGYVKKQQQRRGRLAIYRTTSVAVFRTRKENCCAESVIKTTRGSITQRLCTCYTAPMNQ